MSVPFSILTVLLCYLVTPSDLESMEGNSASGAQRIPIALLEVYEFR
jgi:hypothetical protein